LRPLLDRLDLAVMTADALHSQREHADWLVVAEHAAYVLMVKPNQPTLHRHPARAISHLRSLQVVPGLRTVRDPSCRTRRLDHPQPGPVSWGGPVNSAGERLACDIAPLLR
jgi:hypothetical protein